MGKAEIERRGGGWKYGTKERKPFGTVVDLARRLWLGGFRDWNTAFTTPEPNLRHWHRQIGEATIKQLKAYEIQLSEHRRTVELRPSHTIEILPVIERQDLVYRPFFIDGFPFVFIDAGVGEAIERLVREGVIDDAQLRALQVQSSHLEKGIQFLNRNFGLDLEFQMKDGEAELKIPPTTRVVSHPDVLNLDPHSLLRKPPEN